MLNCLVYAFSTAESASSTRITASCVVTVIAASNARSVGKASVQCMGNKPVTIFASPETLPFDQSFTGTANIPHLLLILIFPVVLTFALGCVHKATSRS